MCGAYSIVSVAQAKVSAAYEYLVLRETQVPTRVISAGGSIPVIAGRETEMETYDFTLILDLNGREMTNEMCDAFYEAGLDDATIGVSGGVPFADLSREAGDVLEAVASAIKDVEDAGVGATVVRVEPDDLVTITDIAERLGRTGESVRLLIRGDRGPGGFPQPVTRLGRRRSRVWRWADVVEWFKRYEPNSGMSSAEQSSVVIAGVNDFLREREYRKSADPLRRQVRQVLGR
jgi:hypothetical protein